MDLEMNLDNTCDINANRRRVALLRHSLPVVIFLLIVPQAGITYLIFNDFMALQILTASVLVVFFYYFFFAFSRKIFSDFQVFPGNSWVVSPASIVGVFLAVVATLAVTAPEIALISALQGGGGDALFDARVAFTKGRSGIELLLVYAYAMLLKGALPIALIMLFASGDKRRWLYVGLVLFALLLSLEKFLTAMVLIPIGLYFWIINRRTLLLGFVLLGLGFLVFASVLSKAGEIVEGQAQNALPPKQNAVFKSTGIGVGSGIVKADLLLLKNSKTQLVRTALSDEDDYRFYLGSSGFNYFFNRAVWIPFVSAYDALVYWTEYHQGKLLLGATSAPVALIFGLHYVNLEQQVFMFQFGGEDDSAGRANTAFFIDSLINFGWLGVVSSSAICGVLFGWFSRCTHPGFAAATVVTSYSLANNALIPMFWSGGILVLIFLALIWRSRPSRTTRDMV